MKTSAPGLPRPGQRTCPTSPSGWDGRRELTSLLTRASRRGLGASRSVTGMLPLTRVTMLALVPPELREAGLRFRGRHEAHAVLGSEAGDKPLSQQACAAARDAGRAGGRVIRGEMCVFQCHGVTKMSDRGCSCRRLWRGRPSDDSEPFISLIPAGFLHATHFSGGGKFKEATGVEVWAGKCIVFYLESFRWGRI